MAVLLVGMFVYDIATRVNPDYQIGLLTPDYMGDETKTELEQLLASAADDRNGDGQTVVSVAVYNMTVEGQAQTDPTAQMAAVTRLSADLQGTEVMLMLTNYPQEYHKNGEMFAYNDGTAPPEGQEPEDSRLGVPLEDCPFFDTFLAGERMEPMEGYRLVKRAVSPQRLAKETDLEESRAAYDALFDKLTATA